jgi:ABC-2 type transport system ATP-binding protein
MFFDYFENLFKQVLSLLFFMIIQVKNLSKTFRTQVKEGGVWGSFKAIFKRRYKYVHAVENVSFKINKGESVAFIGPNGAGKSTTIKMLTGILYPTSGDMSVVGFNPPKDRVKLSFKLGSIFGQKTQLWYHLPARDSFNLFRSIFEIDKKVFDKRLNDLIKNFNIEEFIDVPVRRLSLGQRMKCELVSSLLHDPDVLLLDEPTIGLDIIAKRQLRETIKKLNKEKGKTIILTSHDLEDIENVCDRVIIINHGRILFDDSIDKLKAEYVTKKRIKIITENKPKIIQGRGVEVLKVNDFSIIYEINLGVIDAKSFINKAIKSQKDIVDISIMDMKIEEIIEDFYMVSKDE